MQQPVNGQETVYTTRDTKLRVLRCHEAAVKRIVTEDSPDLFLTVSEVRCRRCTHPIGEVQRNANEVVWRSGRDGEATRFEIASCLRTGGLSDVPCSCAL